MKGSGKERSVKVKSFPIIWLDHPKTTIPKENGIVAQAYIFMGGLAAVLFTA